MIDFSDCPRTNNMYSGSERKIGVIFNDAEYMLKFQTRNELGALFNHVSEHIGSSVFNALGIEAQETMLGTYDGSEVVACRVFGSDTEQFVPFNDVGESSLDSIGKTQYSYTDIMRLLRADRKLVEVDDMIDRFWNMYIVDALLGNFDRHGANWGFIKSNNRYHHAPVFDNGSCLYPRMNDETLMMRVIESEEQTDERVYRYPSSQVRIGNSRSTYYDVIHSLRFEDCNDALRRMYEVMDMDRIYDIVNRTPFITDVHKKFYIHMLRSRYEKIIECSYRELRDA